MKRLEDIVKGFCAKDDEQEWFEFKENWFEPVQLGEYVSALPNCLRLNLTLPLRLQDSLPVEWLAPYRMGFPPII